MKIIWTIEKFLKPLRADCVKKLSKVGIYLTSKLRENLNTAQKYVRYKGGKYYRGLNPSKPGQFPHKLSSQLLKSMAWEVDEEKLAVAAGSNMDGYPVFLQGGTRFMKPRPFLSLTLKAEANEIGKILTK